MEEGVSDLQGSSSGSSVCPSYAHSTVQIQSHGNEKRARKCCPRLRIHFLKQPYVMEGKKESWEDNWQAPSYRDTLLCFCCYYLTLSASPKTELDHAKTTFVKLWNCVIFKKNRITSQNSFFKVSHPLSSMTSVSLSI